MSSSDERIYGGRYHLQRGIARGGMADVFLAHDQLLDRPVALKVLFPELSSDHNFVERFRREAQSAANLSHPNIVGVYDWGEEAGTYFIVMEYVDGRPLSDIIRQDGALDATEAAGVGAEIAAALGTAHRAGMVHRDVKPSNVLVPGDGHAKVTDFGIARAISAAEGLTQTGAVMGTASYFSPEQAQGHALDARSDLYSLGVVLYEMVTGRAPFTGDSPVSVAYKHVKEAPVPVRELAPDVPDGFARIVAKAMAKDPHQRYQTATELADDLRRFRDGHAVSAGPVSDATTAMAAATYDATTAMAPVGDRTSVMPATGGPGSTPPAEQNRSGAFVGVLVGLLVVLGLLIFALLNVLDDGGGDNGGAGDVTVPSVLGFTAEEARTTLEDLGLVVEESFEVNVETPEGVVFAQDPEAGDIVEGDATVTVRISQGEAPVEVQSVVGLSLEDATDVLQGQGLVVRTIEEASEDVPEGEVISQSPETGTSVPRGTTIDVTVSSGKPKAEIPEVAGRSPVEAANILGQAGFSTTQTQQSSDTVASGTVIGTDPPAGTETQQGTEVTIIVSSGPAQVQVPNVIGDTTDAARTKLENAGFEVVVQSQTVFDPGDDGRVIDQDPNGGDTAAKGSTVTITVGEFLDEGSSTTQA